MANKAVDYHRKSLRLLQYDYSSPGAYFVTYVTWHRITLFGEVVHGKMILNSFGRIVSAAWSDLSAHYLHIRLDCWVIMPNHLLGIIVIEDDGPQNIPISQIVGQFKAFTSRKINLIRNSPAGPVWQRNFYERVLRNEKEWDQARGYIELNPDHWEEDEVNHGRVDFHL